MIQRVAYTYIALALLIGPIIYIINPPLWAAALSGLGFGFLVLGAGVGEE